MIAGKQILTTTGPQPDLPHEILILGDKDNESTKGSVDVEASQQPPVPAHAIAMRVGNVVSKVRITVVQPHKHDLFV